MENKSAFFLIDDKQHRSWPYPYSGWDTDFRGADRQITPGDKMPARRLVSNIDTKPTSVKRDITEQFSGTVTFEAMYRPVSGDGFYLGFFNKTDEALKIVLHDGFFYAGSYKLFAADNSKHYIKFVLDIDSGSALIYSDGVFAAKCTFTGKAQSISTFKCGFDEKSIGEAELYHFVKMYKNYYVNDMCIFDVPGKLPGDYEVSVDGNSEVLRKRYSDIAPDCVYEIDTADKSETVISKKFSRAKGNICFEIKYLMCDENSVLNLSLCSDGERIITVSDASKGIFCRGGELRNHSFEVWQTLRFEADTATGTALIRLNGKKVTTLAFEKKIGFFDEIRLELSAKAASCAKFTDIFVFEIQPMPDDYVPEPIVPEKKGDYYVGMNICSLWRTGDHHGWDCITPFDEVKPLLGYYDEGLPETADWELKWMCEHGIDFELYCWYAPERNAPFRHTQLSSAIHGGHMLAKYSDKVKLALLWEAQNAAHPLNAEAFRKYFVPYWIDYFFSDSRYMTIDGKAIMSIFGPAQLVKDFGSPEAVKVEFDYLRSEVKKLGYKDLIIMGCADNTEIYKKCGFDAVHAYGWGTQGYDLEYTKKRILDNIALGNVHVVPTASTGFNHVAWSGERFPNISVDDMKSLLTWARDEILPTYEKDSWKSKLVMLSNWNEYGEGTYISPSGLNGFGYMDAVRSVFLKDIPHTDIAPNEEQKKRIDILHPMDRATIAPLGYAKDAAPDGTLFRKYTFKSKEDLEKWEFHGFSSLEIKDGRLFGHSDQADPYMLLKDDIFPLNTGRVAGLRAHIRAYKPVNQMCCIEAFFSDRPDGVINSRNIYCLTDPKRVAPLTLDFHGKSYFKWKGRVTALRFDPIYAVGDFELVDVELLATPPHRELMVDGVEIATALYSEIIDSKLYIPFDTTSEFADIKGMYYEWCKAKKQLTVYGVGKCVFTVGSDKADFDGREIKLDRPLELKDGVPLIPADLLAEILGYNIEVDDEFIKFTSK